MFCSKCGMELPEGASVCNYCGLSISRWANAEKTAEKVTYWNPARILALTGAILAVTGCFLPCCYYHFFINMAVIFWEGDGKILVACVAIAAVMLMVPGRMLNFLSIIPTVIGVLTLIIDLRNVEKEFGVLVSIGIGSFLMFLGLATMVVAAVLSGVKKK